jgi:hypothetical protein
MQTALKTKLSLELTVQTLAQMKKLSMTAGNHKSNQKMEVRSKPTENSKRSRNR